MRLALARRRASGGGLGGPGDISGQLWHYDRENAYREFGPDDKGFFSALFRRRRTRADRNRDRFTQYISAGGMRHEDAGAAERERTYFQKARVVRWLVILAAVWTVFRFVSL